MTAHHVPGAETFNALLDDVLANPEARESLEAAQAEPVTQFPTISDQQLRQAQSQPRPGNFERPEPVTAPLPSEAMEAACEVMHDAYERAAAKEGWETQERSRKPWSEVPEANKATMRAAITALLAVLPQLLPEPVTAPMPSEAQVRAFQAAWHEADAAGLAGDRTRAGLAAALAVHPVDVTHEVTMRMDLDTRDRLVQARRYVEDLDNWSASSSGQREALLAIINRRDGGW